MSALLQVLSSVLSTLSVWARPLRLEPGDERYLSESLVDYLGAPARERAGSPGSRNNT